MAAVLLKIHWKISQLPVSTFSVSTEKGLDLSSLIDVAGIISPYLWLALFPGLPHFLFFGLCSVYMYTCNTRKQKGAKTALLLLCIILNANRRTKNGWGLGTRLTFDDDGGLLLLSSVSQSLLIGARHFFLFTWLLVAQATLQLDAISSVIDDNPLSLTVKFETDSGPSFHFCSCSETFLSA